MQRLSWDDDLGMKMDIGDIPGELQEQAEEYHHQLIDAVAEHDEELLETYLLDESSVTPEMIRRALRAATLATAVTPVLCGSAFKNKGVQPLLDAVSTTSRARSTSRPCTASTHGRSTSSPAARPTTSRSPRSPSRS